MAIISQETFDKFTEEEKQKIRDYYNDESRYVGLSEQYVIQILFGKDNILLKSKIKTWENVDTIKLGAEYGTIFELQDWNNIKLANKLIATYKIAKLIELGYGGMITEEEWQNPNEKFVIKPYYQKGKFFLEQSTSCNYKHFIAFHTYDQLEEFISYPENVKLVEQYFML